MSFFIDRIFKKKKDVIDNPKMTDKYLIETMKGGKKMEEIEELEEYDDELDEQPQIKQPIKQPVRQPVRESEPTPRQPIRVLREQRQRPKPQPKVEEELPEPPEIPEVEEVPQQQYVAVPRAVPIETMLNEIYDGQQEIKQALAIISNMLERLK